jgi:hypothetical protein
LSRDAPLAVYAGASNLLSLAIERIPDFGPPA